MAAAKLDLLISVKQGFLDITTKSIILTVNTRDIDVYKMKKSDFEFMEKVTDQVVTNDEINIKASDVSKRNSKYGKTFTLNVDVESILKNMKLLHISVRPYKFYVCKRGSSLAKLIDTSLPGLRGTLIFILPTTFEGGEICSSGFNLERSMPKGKLKFLYLDVSREHSVSKVISGKRIMLVYNVFWANSSKNLVDPTVTYLPLGIYEEFLQDTVQFCENKNNVLFGQSKDPSGNDVFSKLLQDLKKQFKVIDVVVDEDSFDVQRNDFSNVKTVYKVDFIDGDYYDSTSSPDLETLASQTYQVSHVLFPQYSTLEKHSIEGTHESSDGHYRYRRSGNESDLASEFEVYCCRAHLIKPVPDAALVKKRKI